MIGVGPRWFLSLLVAVLVAVCAALAVPGPILAAFAGGALGGAVAALVVVWRTLPEMLRPFVADALRAKVRARE